MTLKELLDSLSFDEIAPYLIRHYTCDYASGDLVPYKQHFDYLRSLTPTNRELIENKKVRISLGKHKLNAYPLEGDDWEDSLAKELVLDKDVKASHAEIAACCLWHTSFWGYLPYQREESFRKIITDDPRLIRTAKFYKNKFSEIIPSKREMMQIPSFRNKIRSDMKSVRKNHPKKNGKKANSSGSIEKDSGVLGNVILSIMNMTNVSSTVLLSLNIYQRKEMMPTDMVCFIEPTILTSCDLTVLPLMLINVLTISKNSLKSMAQWSILLDMPTVLSVSVFLQHILFMRCWKYVISLRIYFLKYFVTDLTILLVKK